VFDIGEFHRHEFFDGPICPVGLDEVDGPAGGFCYVCAGNFGVVRDDRCVKGDT
jgi:hypothetical protein